ncbi:MAG: hypothetical protein M3O41_00410 [Pseudomonadota bacterium]|nr:hypothetical protein [Pseudomonadota bacterium]
MPRELSLDHLNNDGLYGLVSCLREDYLRTDDPWYRDEAERVWAELELRWERKRQSDLATS